MVMILTGRKRDDDIANILFIGKSLGAIYGYIRMELSSRKY
jgi:hypothetical protein